MSFGVRGLPLQVWVNGGIIKNEGPDTLYYGAHQNVSPTVNDGSILSGLSATVDGSPWLVSAGVSAVNVFPIIPSSGGGGTGDAGPAGPPGVAGEAANAGRDVELGNLGAGQTLTITDTDDLTVIDVTLTLTQDGVLTIANLNSITRLLIRLWITQDATGTHKFSILNGVGGDQEQVPVDQGSGAETYVEALTYDAGATLRVIVPDVTGGTGGGSVGTQPTITGIAGVGNVLTAHPPGGSANVTYQWQRDLGAISAATSTTYTQVTADIGHDVTVAIVYSPTSTSDPVRVPTPDITYVGSAQQGTTASATNKLLAVPNCLAGDILLGEISCVGGTAQTHTSLATGWAAIAAGRNVNTSGNFVFFNYWYRLTQADVDAITAGTLTSWSFPGTTSQSYRSRTSAFRNAAAAGTPFELATTANGTFSTTVNLVTKTPSVAKEMLIGLIGFPQSEGITWPAGYTDAWGSDYNKLVYKLLADTSATGTVTGTESGTTHKTVTTLLLHP